MSALANLFADLPPTFKEGAIIVTLFIILIVALRLEYFYIESIDLEFQ
ncbi:hypothetical protein [Acidianus bottle-shaped virus 2 strain ABV2]|uniref:Uncharacterized protein n=1 Tax=Acidianus bottle-shaped virus 2 strain ABV2 TaxID=1732173 RepID=A0A0N7FYW5_9VIRU|nr:hypothetical protein AVU01_gp08 [Acidianus bottle-shaped virus 2 strain ABV2]ALG96756.1 hypothetical protein [Acidianus bottle-shaped virus 2 strain ABV2]